MGALFQFQLDLLPYGWGVVFEASGVKRFLWRLKSSQVRIGRPAFKGNLTWLVSQAVVPVGADS